MKNDAEHTREVTSQINQSINQPKGHVSNILIRSINQMTDASLHFDSNFQADAEALAKTSAPSQPVVPTLSTVDSRPVYNKQRQLKDVMKVELLEGRPVKEIAELWAAYHKLREQYVAGVVPAKMYDTITARASLFPVFIYPLPRTGGYEFFVAEFQVGVQEELFNGLFDWSIDWWVGWFVDRSIDWWIHSITLKCLGFTLFRDENATSPNWRSTKRAKRIPHRAWVWFTLKISKRAMAWSWCAANMTIGFWVLWKCSVCWTKCNCIMGRRIKRRWPWWRPSIGIPTRSTIIASLRRWNIRLRFWRHKRVNFVGGFCALWNVGHVDSLMSFKKTLDSIQSRVRLKLSRWLSIPKFVMLHKMAGSKCFK